MGTFSSPSSPMLSKVYDAFVQTYEGLTVSGMQVDCTNRERLGYGGELPRPVVRACVCACVCERESIG